MSKVPEHLIEEARKRGIVPGAHIACAFRSDLQGTVADTQFWEDRGTHIHVGESGPYLLNAVRDGKWATVITPAPSQAEGLKEGDAVECGPAMRAAIIELANELGIRTGGVEPENNHMAGVRFDDPRINTKYDGCFGNSTKLTPEAFIAKMRVTAAQPKPIKIGSDTVKFNADKSITVGCTTVPFTTIETIYNKLK